MFGYSALHFRTRAHPLSGISQSSWAPLRNRAFHGLVGYASFTAQFAELAAGIAFIFYLGDLYHPPGARGGRELVARVLICQGSRLYSSPLSDSPSRLASGTVRFLHIFALTTPGLMIWAAALLAAWSREQMTVRALVVGTGQVGGLIAGLDP